MLKIGIIKEEKKPVDKRVAFSPKQCLELEKIVGIKVVVQPSDERCFSNSDYEAVNISLQENLSDCDYLFGVKEVPIESLLENKKYFFFSHTIKKQPYNQKLLKNLLEKGIQMIDYECLKNDKNQRLLGFGRYAGIVGAYNSILAWGLRNEQFNLKPANLCSDKKEMAIELNRIKIPALKFVLTGGGRVGKGAMELLEIAGIKQVNIDDFKNTTFDYPVFCLLDCEHYYHEKNDATFNYDHFFKNSKDYKSTFAPFLSIADIYISCHFWDNQSEPLFTVEDCQKPNFKTYVIADITCDINGSVPTTIRSSTISNPLFGFNPLSKKEVSAFDKNAITIMAVDTLPCELPKDASVDFGDALLEHVIPSLLNQDSNNIINRASICLNGKLNSGYEYLKEYAGL